MTPGRAQGVWSVGLFSAMEVGCMVWLMSETPGRAQGLGVWYG